MSSVAMYQVTAPTSPATVKLCDVYPGQTTIITSTSASADVFVGLSPTVTAATGVPVDTGGPLVIQYPTTAPRITLYCTSGTGTHAVGIVAMSN